MDETALRRAADELIDAGRALVRKRNLPVHLRVQLDKLVNELDELQGRGADLDEVERAAAPARELVRQLTNSAPEKLAAPDSCQVAPGETQAAAVSPVAGSNETPAPAPRDEQGASTSQSVTVRAPLEIEPHIPEGLKSVPAWLLWRYEEKPGEGKPRKVPYYVSGGRRSGTQGSPADLAKLATFDSASAAYKRGGFDGLGIAMLAQWECVGLDFDGCVDEHGEVRPEVVALIAGTYCEFSPSGKGVRAFMRGALPDRKAKADSDFPFGFEVFHAKGFLTVTGRALEVCKLVGDENTLAPVTAETLEHYAKRFGAPSRPEHDSRALNDLDRAAKLAGATLETVADIKLALAHLATKGWARDEQKWIDVCYALRSLAQAGFEKEACELWHWFSELCPEEYSYEVAEDRWTSPSREPHSITFVSIFKWAQAAGWINPRSGAAKGPAAPIKYDGKPRTAAALLRTKFLPIQWAVPRILPEGTYLLVSPPKIGKSWLALQIAIAVAGGSDVLGQRAEAGSVLYLALEDGDRRLQSRLLKLDAELLLDDEAAGRLSFETRWPRIDEDGGAALDVWLQAHPDARLVVIDVLERFRAPRSPKGNLYGEDYAAMQAVKSLAEKYRVAFLVVHHTRKSEAADPLEMVSGTQGLAGGADGVLLLKRSRGTERGELHVIGRDLEDEGAFVVDFQRATCRWEMVGSASVVAPTASRQAVLDALREAREPLKHGEIAAAIKKTTSNTSNLLRKLIGEGLVTKTEDGRYTLNDELDEFDELSEQVSK